MDIMYTNSMSWSLRNLAETRCFACSEMTPLSVHEYVAYPHIRGNDSRIDCIKPLQIHPIMIVLRSAYSK